jgi:hypothetical protein
MMVRTLLGALLVAMSAGVLAQARTPTPPASAVDPAEQKAVAPAHPDQPNPIVDLKPETAVAAPVPLEPAPVPSPEPAEAPTVSGPRNTTQKSTVRLPTTPPVAGRPVKISAGGSVTVKAYEKGKRLTIIQPSGVQETYRLAPGAVVPSDLVPGKIVSLEWRVRNSRRTVTKVSYATHQPVISN